MERKCPQDFDDKEQSIMANFKRLKKQLFHGSITINFNRGVPQLSRIRMNDYYDATRQ
jgi:hypothetical protein